MASDYWMAKSELEAALKYRDAIQQERSMLRKNRELSREERDYIWKRLTEQIVDMRNVIIECGNAVARHERYGKPHALVGKMSGLSDWRYRYAS